MNILTFFDVDGSRSPMLEMPSSIEFRAIVIVDVSTIVSFSFVDDAVALLLLLPTSLRIIDIFSCFTLTTGTFLLAAGGGIFSLWLSPIISTDDWDSTVFLADVPLERLLAFDSRSILTVTVWSPSFSRRIFRFNVGSFMDTICLRAVRIGRINCDASSARASDSLLAAALLFVDVDTQLSVSSTSVKEISFEKKKKLIRRNSNVDDDGLPWLFVRSVRFLIFFLLGFIGVSLTRSGANFCNNCWNWISNPWKYFNRKRFNNKTIGNALDEWNY